MGQSDERSKQHWFARAIFNKPRVRDWKAWALRRESTAEAKALDAWHDVFFFIGSRLMHQWAIREGFYV